MIRKNKTFNLSTFSLFNCDITEIRAGRSPRAFNACAQLYARPGWKGAERLRDGVARPKIHPPPKPEFPGRATEPANPCTAGSGAKSSSSKI